MRDFDLRCDIEEDITYPSTPGVMLVKHPFGATGSIALLFIIICHAQPGTVQIDLWVESTVFRCAGAWARRSLRRMSAWNARVRVLEKGTA